MPTVSTFRSKRRARARVPAPFFVAPIAVPQLAKASGCAACEYDRPMALGFQGSGDWLDLSDYVVHFTKGGEDAGAETLIHILGGGLLRRGPDAFGAARDVWQLRETQRAVCFSEIPLGFLHRIVERRRSRYGIGFHKRFVQAHGGAPLWYVEHGSQQHQAIDRLMQRARASTSTDDDPVWHLTPFVDIWAKGTPYTYDFRWEREWRLTNDLAFTPDDVEFVFMPEDVHQTARDFFKEHYDAGTGPAYFCPFIDPTWSVERIESALENEVPGIWKQRVQRR